MDNPDIKTTAGGRTTALLASIPEYLKDHKNFKKIYKAIADAGASKHSHGDMETWAKCLYCTKKQNARLLMMKSLGFTSKAMYLSWLKIHQDWDRRVPLR